MISPHGGKLTNRIPNPSENVRWQEYALFQHKIQIDQFTAMELELIATGAYSPLTGFMQLLDYRRVLIEGRLVNSGLSWALPVTLAVSKSDASQLYVGEDVTLQNHQGENLAVMRIEEIFLADKQLEVEALYNGAGLSHPGVLKTHQQGEVLLGGPIIYLGSRKPNDRFADYFLSPAETRSHFEELGWHSILAFEPRNPSIPGNHKLANALEKYDGIFLHTLAGDLSGEDLPADVKVRCSEILLQEYYPPHKTLLAVSTLILRGAGSRDVLHEAIVRKNFGATHMIAGDEHLDLLEKTESDSARLIATA
jgi:sulfate adenylyltransferase